MDTSDQQQSIQCILDRAKFALPRGKKLRQASLATRERSSELRMHDWQAIAVGRVCSNCRLTQADGEFDDEPLCVA
jgi:hypothetical protein